MEKPIFHDYLDHTTPKWVQLCTQVRVMEFRSSFTRTIETDVIVTTVMGQYSERGQDHKEAWFVSSSIVETCW